MSKFIPNAGDLCYITFKPIVSHRITANGDDESTSFRDRSYGCVVFVVAAIDSILAVLHRHAGAAIYGKSVIVRVGDVTFDPVSPEVLKALEEQQ